MKVVLFCGGKGMRMREYSQSIPKPMVNIGNRPILWHLMKYYAHYGHNEFILCLGWQGDIIKEYFLNYNDYLSNDFVLSMHDKKVEFSQRERLDWKITFVDTGADACIGERLSSAKKYLCRDEPFLANYADAVTDVCLNELIRQHQQQDAIATFTSVRPSQSFHTVDSHDGGRVTCMARVDQRELWINGGFFVLAYEFFDYLQPGEDLVDEPFERLISERRLWTYKHDGFWACMDTYKEKQQLDEMIDSGSMPWQVWLDR